MKLQLIQSLRKSRFIGFSKTTLGLMIVNIYENHIYALR